MFVFQEWCSWARQRFCSWWRWVRASVCRASVFKRRLKRRTDNEKVCWLTDQTDTIVGPARALLRVKGVGWGWTGDTPRALNVESSRRRRRFYFSFYQRTRSLARKSSSSSKNRSLVLSLCMYASVSEWVSECTCSACKCGTLSAGERGRESVCPARTR